MFLGVGVLTAEAQQRPERFVLDEPEPSHQLLTRTPFAGDPTGTRGANTLQLGVNSYLLLVAWS